MMRNGKEIQKSSNLQFWYERRLDLLALSLLVVGICFFMLGFQMESEKRKEGLQNNQKPNITVSEKSSVFDDIIENRIQEKMSDKDIHDAQLVQDITILEESETEDEITEPVEQFTFPITTRSPDDPYPDDKEVVATITIPSINLYEPVVYGDSQENVDLYEVTLRNGHMFHQNAAVLLAGHNYKSFGKLAYANIGDQINIHSYYGDFSFLIDGIRTGHTDGWNVYDEQGNALIDIYTRENRLYLYTCTDANNGRLVVSATMV